MKQNGLMTITKLPKRLPMMKLPKNLMVKKNASAGTMVMKLPNKLLVMEKINIGNDSVEERTCREQRSFHR